MSLHKPQSPPAPTPEKQLKEFFSNNATHPNARMLKSTRTEKNNLHPIEGVHIPTTSSFAT